MKPNIGIDQKKLDSSCKILSVVLADEMILYTKTRKFHWNVSGNSFMELHKLFEEQYNALEVIIDDTAERINQLGAKTIGTMKEFLELTTLSEAPNTYPNQKEMLTELCSDNEKIIQYLRENITVCDENDDAGSADFLTGLLKSHEKNAWILRRYLS
jgi:starvation-inducible DNA-binding protein